MMQTLIIVLAVLLVAFCGVMIAILRIGGEIDDMDNSDDSGRTD